MRNAGSLSSLERHCVPQPEVREKAPRSLLDLTQVEPHHSERGWGGGKAAAHASKTTDTPSSLRDLADFPESMFLPLPLAHF